MNEKECQGEWAWASISIRVYRVALGGFSKISVSCYRVVDDFFDIVAVARHVRSGTFLSF